MGFLLQGTLCLVTLCYTSAKTIDSPSDFMSIARYLSSKKDAVGEFKLSISRFSYDFEY
jgi:hypothetical protein